MPDRLGSSGETTPKNIPPVASSGSRMKRYQGGVEIPKGERPWALHLTKDFSHLNPEIQKKIIDIIGNLRKEDPEKAVEIAHKIGDFFSHTGDYAKEMNVSIQDFLGELEDKLSKERNRQIQ